MKNANYSTLSEFAEHIAFETPDQVISTYRDEINVYTIKELNDRANLLAKGLLHQGVGKGTRVALVLAGTTNCLQFVIALAKIGGILIPIPKELDPSLMVKILKEEKIQTVCFFAEEFLNTFKKIVTELDQNERGYLTSKKFPDLKNIITLGSIKNRGMFTTRELMLVGSHIDDFEVEESLMSVQPKDVFIRRISFDAHRKKKIEKITHKEILSENFSFSTLQNFLLNNI